MAIKKALIIRTVVLISIIFFILIFGVTLRQKQLEKTQHVVVVGIPKEGQGGLEQELNYASKQVSYIKSGNLLLKQGNIDSAISKFQIALSLAKSPGSKGEAHFYLANAYEKNRDYKDALKEIKIVRDQYTNDWAKGPIVERAKYLEYALKGDYELAVKHAQKALDEDKKLPNVPKDGSPDYIERLNDIIATKDYILSLKKTN